MLLAGAIIQSHLQCFEKYTVLSMCVYWNQTHDLSNTVLQENHLIALTSSDSIVIYIFLKVKNNKIVCYIES